MTRIILIWAGIVAGALALIALGGLMLARSLFAEPGVPRLADARGALGEAGWLFVFAHPDDEITANALMARGVAEGVPVHLFTATRGEAGTQYPPVVDQPHLGIVREAEARRHGFSLGVASHTVLDMGDGQLRARPFDELVERVAAEIERTRPSAVISFHPESAISLHPDHMAIGEAARQAVEALGEEGPRLVYVLAPRPGLRQFGGERGQLIADIQPDPDFAVPAPSRDKRRAWRIHESQSRYLQATYGIGPRVMYALWTREYYAFSDSAD
ncbi:MAG: PIG-L family deacetylase [Oceanicaulis sp.]|uniref:PIG-L deacetylase family protein n=1 Tax=Glycocaulis sp. TaxID=1969725 RepID=UPI0025BD5353|nr:PIG-L family deacetylase [Glycocaulis sp.]MCC5981292.1 PIG-L family deacetylase [Oceanicaulis sp.]MCH8520716.1 PIG-L family deacetylase [Glycocaulis sp.]